MTILRIKYSEIYRTEIIPVHEDRTRRNARKPDAGALLPASDLGRRHATRRPRGVAPADFPLIAGAEFRKSITAWRVFRSPTADMWSRPAMVTAGLAQKPPPAGRAPSDIVQVAAHHQHRLAYRGQYLGRQAWRHGPHAGRQRQTILAWLIGEIAKHAAARIGDALLSSVSSASASALACSSAMRGPRR